MPFQLSLFACQHDDGTNDLRSRAVQDGDMNGVAILGDGRRVGIDGTADIKRDSADSWLLRQEYHCFLLAHPCNVLLEGL